MRMRKGKRGKVKIKEAKGEREGEQGPEREGDREIKHQGWEN